MIPTVDQLVEAYRRGRAWDARFPSLANLDEGRIRKMNGSEQDARDLMASLQNSDAQIDALVAAFHKGRTLIADGDVGPATEALLKIPRCPIPDFAPPPGATFDLGDPSLNKAVETMQAFATGTGGWPASGCDPLAAVKNVHAIRVRIDPTRATSTQKAYLQQACDAAAESYRDMGILVRYILTDPSIAAEIVKWFENLLGGVIGWNEFVSPGRCSQIEGRLDIGYSPSDWWMFAELEGHETGHGLGLSHTRGGRMNPSIIRTPNVRSWRGDPSEAALRRMYGGEPIILPTPGPSPIPPPPGGQKIVIENSPGMAVAQRVRALQPFTAAKDEILGEFYYKHA